MSFCAFITTATHVEWHNRSVADFVRVVFYDSSVIVNKKQLQLTADALRGQIHRRIQQDRKLAFLSLSFNAAYSDEEELYIPHDMEIVAREEVDGKLRAALFLATTPSSFVEVGGCDFGDPVTICRFEDTFTVCEEVEDYTRLVSYQDLKSQLFGDIHLAWEAHCLLLLERGAVFKVLETCLTQEEVMDLLRDQKLVYHLLYSPFQFADWEDLIEQNIVSQHSVCAWSSDRKFLLISGPPGSQEIYFDIAGTAHAVVLSNELNNLFTLDI